MRKVEIFPRLKVKCMQKKLKCVCVCLWRVKKALGRENIDLSFQQKTFPEVFRCEKYDGTTGLSKVQSDFLGLRWVLGQTLEIVEGLTEG